MAYVIYTAKREIEPTGFSKTGTDLSAIGSDDSFDAVTTNLSGLLIDQWLQAAGFLKNAGWFQVKSNSTSGKILTNTPPVTHLRLPGISGNVATTPDSAANSVTGPIELMAKLSAVDWTAPVVSVLEKDDGATDRDYALQIQAATGKLVFFYSNDGSTLRSAVSTAALPFTDGGIGYLKATYNTATGDVKFYTSTDGVVFTQLGTTVVITAGTIHNGTAILRVGNDQSGSQGLNGRVYYAEVRNGIGGPVVAAFDPSRATRGAATLVALTGETWTVNSSGASPALFQGTALTYEGAEYLSQSATGSATTPDSAAVSVTGDIELTAKLALADWTPASVCDVINKDDGATNRDYFLQVDTAGKLEFNYSSNGTTVRNAVSTVVVPFADGATGWIKVTYATATGVTKFYTSTDGVNFTQLGADVTITSGAIHDGNQILRVASDAGGTQFLNGKLYYAEIRNGIGGPVVAAFDPGRAAASAGSLIAYTGETWTLTGAASLVRTTPITITGYKRGFGQSYNLEFKAEQVDRKMKFKRNEQRPLGGGAAEVLFQYSDPTVDVLTEILSESSQVPQFREFLASVAAGEVFTFDRYGTVASPVDPRQAQLESVGYDEKRVMTTMQQRIPFTVRLLS